MERGFHCEGLVGGGVVVDKVTTFTGVQSSLRHNRDQVYVTLAEKRHAERRALLSASAEKRLLVLFSSSSSSCSCCRCLPGLSPVSFDEPIAKKKKGKK